MVGLGSALWGVVIREDDLVTGRFVTGLRELGRSGDDAGEAVLSRTIVSLEIKDGEREAMDCVRLLSKLASVVVATVPSVSRRIRQPC